LKNIVEGQQRLLVENNEYSMEEAPDILNGDQNGDDKSESPNSKSLKEYEEEDLKIDDLVYDDESSQENDSGSFEYEPKNEKEEGKKNGKIESQTKYRSDRIIK